MTSVSADWMRLSRAVRDRREELGLTQNEAANRSEGGVSLATWRNIETGFRPPWRRAGLLAVCRVLGWTPESIERILAGEGPEAVKLLTPSQEDRLLALERQLAELRAELRATREEPDDQSNGPTSKSA